jgi:uncharacterized membrane protein (DUF4010 family)
MELEIVFQRLAIALGLGLLVGLQREKAGSSLAGIRTFGMIAALGAIAALLSQTFGGWYVGAGLVALTALFVIGNLAKIRAGVGEPGQTTEVAGLLVYGVGALAMSGQVAVAAALGGAIAVLLHFKQPMHAFIHRMGEDDLRVIMQFVLVSLVILPVLPRRTFGPYDVLNPFEIWLMVVLIVGLGLAGFVAYRLFGAKSGSVLGGILGGLVSSTATTISASRSGGSGAAVIVLIATAVMMVRILVEIAIAGPRLLGAAALPLAALGVVLAVAGVLALRLGPKDGAAEIAQANPAELRTAIVFGALYAVITLAAAAAKDYAGDAGLYAVAAISGLTDLDAIMLSTARTVQESRLEPNQGWRVVLIAVFANLAFKTGIVALSGNRPLLRAIAVVFAITFGIGLAFIFLLP